MEEYRKTRIERYARIGSLTCFLTGKITEAANLELQKKLLSFHRSFNVMDLFRAMDTQSRGYVTQDDMEAYFSSDEEYI